jgi:putative transposase
VEEEIQSPLRHAHAQFPAARTYLPRLSREHYKGDAVVLWTLTILHRATGWLDESFHHYFRELTFHSLAREALVCPIYCLMPDHLHLIWMGLSRESDQFNAMAFLRTHLEPKLAPHKLQSQSHDHILRQDERKRNGFAKVCSYIAENPVRAKLAARDAWRFTGCVLAGYPTLNFFQDDYWPKFWRIYYRLKHPDAAKVTKPPIQPVQTA